MREYTSNDYSLQPYAKIPEYRLRKAGRCLMAVPYENKKLCFPIRTGKQGSLLAANDLYISVVIPACIYRLRLRLEQSPANTEREKWKIKE